MKYVLLSCVVASSVVAATAAHAGNYMKFDLGYTQTVANYQGAVDDTTLNNNRLKPAGGLLGLGVGSQTGDYRAEGLVNIGLQSKKFKAGAEHFKVKPDRISLMMNFYYDRHSGILSPYAMTGIGYGLYSANIKKIGDDKYKLKRSRGYAAQVGLGTMLRLTDTTSFDLGLRAGVQKSARGNNKTTIDSNNFVIAKYGLVYSLITGLKVDL